MDIMNFDEWLTYCGYMMDGKMDFDSELFDGCDLDAAYAQYRIDAGDYAE